jgi:heme-degrading monooxygenase HmoA
MDARLVTLTPKPGHLDALAAFWDERVVADISGRDGNQGFVLLKDTASDRLIGVSLWDSATDAEAAGPTFRSHMAGVAEHLAAPPHASVVEVVASSATVLSR